MTLKTVIRFCKNSIRKFCNGIKTCRVDFFLCRMEFSKISKRDITFIREMRVVTSVTQKNVPSAKVIRAIERSENPEVPVLFGGHNRPPWLTDLPKSGHPGTPKDNRPGNTVLRLVRFSA